MNNELLNTSKALISLETAREARRKKVNVRHARVQSPEERRALALKAILNNRRGETSDAVAVPETTASFEVKNIGLMAAIATILVAWAYFHIS